MVLSGNGRPSHPRRARSTSSTWESTFLNLRAPCLRSRTRSPRQQKWASHGKFSALAPKSIMNSHTLWCQTWNRRMESTIKSRTRRTAQQKVRRALECTSGSSAPETQSTKPSHGTLSAAQERTLTPYLHAPTAPVWMLNAKNATTGKCECFHARSIRLSSWSAFKVAARATMWICSILGATKFKKLKEQVSSIHQSLMRALISPRTRSSRSSVVAAGLPNWLNTRKVLWKATLSSHMTDWLSFDSWKV